MKCYSRGLLSEWEHFYDSQRILSFTWNCSYSQLLRYSHQNVTKIIRKDILKNEPERTKHSWQFEKEGEKKEDKLVEMFTTIAMFTVSCLANSMLPVPSKGQFMSSTSIEHKSIHLGGSGALRKQSRTKPKKSYLCIIVKSCTIFLLHIFPTCCEESQRVEIFVCWLLSTCHQFAFIEKFRCITAMRQNRIKCGV